MRISDWSSDVCSSDLIHEPRPICRIVYGGNGMVWVEANWPPSIKDCYARCIHVTLSQERARDRLRLVRRLTLTLSERRSRPLQRLVREHCHPPRIWPLLSPTVCSRCSHTCPRLRQ